MNFCAQALGSLLSCIPIDLPTRPVTSKQAPKPDQVQLTDMSQSGRNLQIQMSNGNVMNIPVDKSINISEEVNRSGVWKTVNCSNVVPPPSSSDKSEATCRHNRRRQK